MQPSRRRFLAQSSRLVAGSVLAGPALSRIYAAGNNTIRLALVGCGGRGTGAVADAFAAKGGPVKLIAMADLFEPRLKSSYDNLIALAQEAEPFRFVIDPDWEGFLRPEDMPDAIQRYCIQTGQVVPRSCGEFVRGICESLALKYRLVLDELKQFSSQPIRRIHIIGGGAKNQLLCQFTANATGLPVYAGPSEATAIGNLMVQSIACGLVSSLDSMRQIIRHSFEVTPYEPDRLEEWEEALELFRRKCKTELENGQDP